MKDKINIKIIGEELSSLFLALLLLKSGFKVKIEHKNCKYKKIRPEKIYLISHSTKSVLDDLNLWCHLKDNAYSIESLLVSDMSILKKLNFSILDFKGSIKNLNNIGWILNYSDISKLLLKELSKFSNAYRELDFELENEKSDPYNNLKSTVYKKFNNSFFIPFSNKKNNSVIEFNVSIRGNVDKKLYSIFSENGLIFLFPINKEKYRAKWIIKNSLLEGRLTYGNSFLLDNLSTIIPNELKIDQIYGDLNIITNNLKSYENPSKSINSLKISKGRINIFNLVLDDINLSFSEVIYIYNQIKINRSKNFASYSFLKLKIYILREIKLIFFYILFKIFTLNNYFLNFYKKIFIYLLKKISILKKLIFNFIILNI